MLRAPPCRKRSSPALRVIAVALLCAAVSFSPLNFTSLVSRAVSPSKKQIVAQGLRDAEPALASSRTTSQQQLSSTSMSARGGDADTVTKGGMDIQLIIFIALWYLGNYYYNITNKLALKAGGGAAGFPMTIATLQLGVGVIYALFMWAAPDARPTPKLTFGDWMKTLPVGFTSAGAHAASVFALSAGAVSFGQIVKAAEPAFAALIGTLFYGAKVSGARWLMLIPIIGGVCLASLGELDFAMAALVTAATANVFAAVKANENKRLMSTEGLKERMGSIGNQFAVTSINSFLFCLPLMIITEGKKFGEFIELVRGGGMGTVLFNNMLASGLWFYLYNELATMTIKKTGAVTQSVLNTAKRAVVILGCAVVLGENLSTMKLIGSLVCIGGVFLYSTIDNFIKK